MAKDQHGHKAHLIVEFWGSTFESHGCNDVTKWIHYVDTTQRRLLVLGETISDASKVAMFLQALPDIFTQFRITLYGKTPTWAELLVLIRQYSNVTEVREQLKNLSSAQWHAKSAHQRPTGGVFAIKGQEQESKSQARTNGELPQLRQRYLPQGGFLPLLPHGIQDSTQQQGYLGPLLPLWQP